MRATVCLLAVTAAMAPDAAWALRIGAPVQSPLGVVSAYQKLELTFLITDLAATMPQWPYDPAPPNGVPAGVGASVDAIFTDPAGHQFRQPAFHAETYRDEVRAGRDWHLPTGQFAWRVRFSPNLPGTWTYKIVARDARGANETSERAFTVGPAVGHGFIKVSAADSRYFEFDDGSPFFGMGVELPSFLEDPVTRGGPELSALASNGINVARIWISNIFGSAWPTWIGGRNQYRGYLPVTGLVPFTDAATGRTTLAMKLDYEPAGDTGWFDACRMQFWDDPESIEPGKTYRLQVQYRGVGIAGPRDPAHAAYGLVAKMGGWLANCHEPGTGVSITSHGVDNAGWGLVEGTWQSGGESFLPRLHLGLENVTQGAAYVRSVSLREELGGGAFGPELMRRPSMEHELYVGEEQAYALDRIVEQAASRGVYLKLVVMERNDKIYFKMEDNGDWVATADNEDGFYGTGRVTNKTRWLQQMWWRYLQARWGYSPAIHSWELTNEGDPSLVAHYQLADEFGKFMHCRAFGVEPGTGDGARCAFDHPNDHLVTTSFWQGFPAAEFWMNAAYPNVDYADLHAYVSTSFASPVDRDAMQWDSAFYHLWHSRAVASAKPTKPVVRGEAGLDSPGEQSESVLGLSRDTSGAWLHDFLWSSLDAGGLTELYWWTTHIWGPTFDHRPAYANLRNFAGAIPLNKGGYVDWGGTVSTSAIRVVGQKNPARAALHLWVQNSQHTWKHVVDGVPVAPVSGEIVVPGFRPSIRYVLERWDTYAPGGRVVSTEDITSDVQGRLHVAVADLRTDVALRLATVEPGTPGAPRNVRVSAR